MLRARTQLKLHDNPSAHCVSSVPIGDVLSIYHALIHGQARVSELDVRLLGPFEGYELPERLRNGKLLENLE